MSARRLLLALLLAAAPGALAGGSVFLNGQPIDGTTGVTIDKARVHIDGAGNIHIDAPGYAVKRVDARTGEVVEGGSRAGSRTIGGPVKLTRRYWLATELSQAGLAGYDVDVFINDELAFRIRQQDPQLSREITGRLRPGPNPVRFVARKVGSAAPDVGERTPFLRVLLAEGTEQADRIVLERPSVVFTRTAAEDGHRTEDFTLVTR